MSQVRIYPSASASDSEVVLKTPPKRRRLVIPHTPHPTANRSSQTYLNLDPKTPYRDIHTPFPYSTTTPSDSPSNPFGRKRALNLALPPKTAFSKHLPLRFQYIPPGGGGRNGINKEGVFRVVQVPLNYTFRHLHQLIFFLFGGVAVEAGPGQSEIFNTTRELRSTTTSKPNPLSPFDPETSSTRTSWHDFQIQHSVEMYKAHYKPGQIQKGETWARLSSCRDPYNSKVLADSDASGNESEFGSADGDDELGVLALEYKEGQEKQFVTEMESELEFDLSDRVENNQKVVWRAEEDTLIGDAWPVGGDLGRAIIYQHDSTCAPSSSPQVHITVNNILRLPTRRGIDNKPYVFMARGLVDIWTPNLQKKDIPNPEVIPDPWNDETAFQEFLQLAQDHLTSKLARSSSGKRRRSSSSSICSRPRQRRRLDDVFLSDVDLLVSTPGMTPAASSSSSMAFPSSPFPTTHSPQPYSYSSTPAYSSLLPLYVPTPSVTPGPTRRLHRLRVERLSRQLVKSTHKMMRVRARSLTPTDDEADQVDELAEGYDPFGDEAEL